MVTVVAFNPTDEQRPAIYEKGSIIVSASAGSGKTAVLVERVIKMLSDIENPIMADKLLVVTFTNAAAAELRFRIEKRLNEELENSPNNVFLQRQRILINNAKICTIDSFCIDFLKENFEKSGLLPTFKIADNPTLRHLERTALSEVFNECFDCGDSDFLKLHSFIGEDFDDSKLQKCVYQIFEFSRHMPYPTLWLDSISEQYKNHAEQKSDLWFDAALESVEDIATDATIESSQALKFLELSPEAYEKYAANYSYFYNISNSICELCRDKRWDDIYGIISVISPPKCKSLSSDEKTEYVLKSIKLRDNAKKTLDKIKKIVYGTRQQIADEAKYLLPYVSKIISLVKEFENKLYKLLEKEGLITFYIAEQTVLNMISSVENGEIVPSVDSKEYCKEYQAILVDEYQDTNTLQDTLFTILSDDGRKLFCVGDMKQCIYKFRGSNPLNFLEKKELAVPLKDRLPDQTLRVDLGCNFRSRPEVCSFINSVFEKILYKKNSNFDYDNNEKLVPMAEFPVSDVVKVENHFIDYNSISENTNVLFDSKIEAEAHVAANIILNTVNNDAFLKDGNGLRKAGFGDITILVRSMRDKGDVFIRVLKERGIPVTMSTSDVLDSDEVNTLISMLKVINNPSDDIALATIMTSPAFAFSIGEIANMRASHKFGNLISAVTTAAKQGNLKAEKFLTTIGKLRRKNTVLSTELLIEEIFDETNLLNIMSSLSNGDIKRLNLLSLQNLASSFDSEGKRDLRYFLNYLSELENRDFALAGDASDSVTVMSIHKSKGLQFPICILANTANQFNQQDIRESVMVSEKFGFSAVYYDDSGTKKDNTLLLTVMKHEEKKNLLAEELRIFYVALTRAEEKLITLSTYNNVVDEIAKKREQLEMTASDKKVEYTLFRKNNSYSDWILESLLIDGKSDLLLGKIQDENIIVHNTLYCEETVCSVEKSDSASESNVEDLTKLYSYKYPYAELLGLQAKSSVTELVHKADDKNYRFTRRPAFMQEKSLSSAEKGTATHKVMQYADFIKCRTALGEELDRLYEYMYLTENEYNAIDSDALKAFFESSLCDRIINSNWSKREMRFLTEFPAYELADNLSSVCKDEMIVVQGAVDLVFEENGRLTIVDFKTDRNKCEDELLSAYGQQLKIYAKACEKLLKKPVEELIIYSLSIGKPIKVK